MKNRFKCVYSVLWLATVVGSLIVQPRPIMAQNNPTVKGLVSYYGCEACKYNKTKDCRTANGESLYKLIQRHTLYCASWDYPFGTRLRIYNPKTRKSVVCTVVDRGPAKRLKRLVDISPEAFSRIAEKSLGVIEAQIEVLK